jgi:Rrf2 family protein
VRISARTDYALRALIELASAEDGPVKGDRIANAQDIPIKFLENILAELRRHGLVDARRGAEGGYWLRVPAESVTVADVIRIIDGPLANIRGLRPDEISYPGNAAPLKDVWMALRTSMREVLEHVTLADLAAGRIARAPSDERP